jgi:peroxiredoxin Q/BCP
MPNVGDQAPNFELPNQDGKTIKLSDYRGQKVILFAYPKADTAGCTRQACGFRDNFPKVKTSNAVVLGLSPDPQPDLRAWIQKINLPYDLLSDVDHSVLNAWGAWNEERVTRSYWVIDENGKVIAGQVKVSPEDSVEQALAAVGG